MTATVLNNPLIKYVYRESGAIAKIGVCRVVKNMYFLSAPPDKRFRDFVNPAGANAYYTVLLKLKAPGDYMCTEQFAKGRKKSIFPMKNIAHRIYLFEAKQV